jgi:hypothetical protein
MFQSHDATQFPSISSINLLQVDEWLTTIRTSAHALLRPGIQSSERVHHHPLPPCTSFAILSVSYQRIHQKDPDAKLFLASSAEDRLVKMQVATSQPHGRLRPVSLTAASEKPAQEEGVLATGARCYCTAHANAMW